MGSLAPSRYYVQMLRMLGHITVMTVLFVTLGTGLFLIAVWKVDDVLTESVLHIGIIESPEVSTKSFFVFDLESGVEIFSKNSADILPIASVTKLFAASAFLKSENLNGTTTVTWGDVNTEGRAGKLHANEEYKSRELLYPLLLESSNDAATSLARTDSDLLAEMDAYAKEQGFNGTTFSDASGLSDKNVSTAHELAMLSRDLYLSEPHIFDITRLKQYIGSYTGWVNNNPFIHDKSYRGGKHGFTYEANRTGVFFFEEELLGKNARVFGYVVLGSDDLASDVELLREQVQENVSFQ